MRLLFTSTPLIGHLLPLLPLARAASRAGHEVVIASGADLRDEIQRRGFTAWSAGPTMAQIRAAQAPPQHHDGLDDDERILAQALALFIRPSALRATDLEALTSTWRPDFVISELYELGAGYVESTSGRRVVHGLGADFPRFADFAAVGHAEMARWLGGETKHADYLSAPYVDPFPTQLQPADRPWPDVRPVRPDAGAVPLGAVLPQSFRGLPYQRTVYLTLGTVFNALDGWRAPLDALGQLPLNVLVTTGPGLDPAELGPLPPNVVAERFVPQTLLLPRCSAVVCHAGSGTVLGALAHGVPLVLLPMGADQFANAAAIGGAGAGIALTPEQADADAIRAAVVEALGNPSYRQVAQDLAGELAGLPDADALLAELLGPVTNRAGTGKVVRDERACDG